MTTGSTHIGRGHTSASPPLGASRQIAVAAIWLATLVGAIALASAGQLGGVFGSGVALMLPGLAVDVMAFASVGAILTLRRPEVRIGLVLLVAAALIVLTFLGFFYGAALTTARGKDDVVAGFTSLLGVLGIFPAFIMAGPMLALVLPDGHLPGPRWRWPVRAIAAAVAVGSASFVTRPGAIGDSLANNPLGVARVAWLETLSGLGEALYWIALPSALLLGLAGVVVRFRRSRGVERQQLKWFAAAIVAFMVFLLLGNADGATQPTMFDVLAVWSLSLPPIAIGIAVLRYRLFEIDRIISRTIGWAVVTGVIAAVFAGTVVGLQAVLVGVTQSQTVPVAVSTLVAFAAFQPVRRRVQAGVDRRFNRARYDAERTATDFAERLRDQVDLASLSGDFAGVVDAALHPRTVGVWIRPSGRGGTA
jgi:hypothetical protein